MPVIKKKFIEKRQISNTASFKFLIRDVVNWVFQIRPKPNNKQKNIWPHRNKAACRI